MKISAAWLCVIVGLVTIQYSQQAAPTPAMVGQVIDGAGKLTDIIVKLDDAFLKPITEQVNKEIAKINTDLDGLVEEEKKMVVDAKKKLLRGRSDITRTRTILIILADETISRSGLLVRLLDALLKGKLTAEKQKRGLTMTIKKMKDLMARSAVLLKDAKDMYRTVGQTLGDSKVDLEEFAKRVVILADRSGTKFEAAKKALRMKVYASLTPCVLLPPVCAIAYPIAAAAVESEIKKWGKNLDQLKAQCKNTEENAKAMVKTIDNEINYLQAEEKLVIVWESKMNAVYEELKADDYVDNVITMDMILSEGYHINQLGELIEACKAFKVHAQAASNDL